MPGYDVNPADQKKGCRSCTCSGQVTIFMLLLFMLVFSVLIAQYHSATVYACRADAERAARLSLDSLLAAYQRPLRERYQILAVDGGFGQNTFRQEQLENGLMRVFEANMKSGITQIAARELSMDEPIFVMLVDGEWDFFLREIMLNREDAMVTEGMELLMGQWDARNKEASEDLRQKRQDAREQSVEDRTETADGTVIAEEQEVSDPRDAVTRIWNQGILKAACPADYSVSEKECMMTDVSFPEAVYLSGTFIDFKDDADIQGLFGKWKEILNPGHMAENAAEEAAVLMYIQDVFQNASQNSTGDDRVLDYETEYIIAGNEKDSENLKNVLWRILAVRCVMNLSCILASPEMGGKVMETAGMLSAALLIPEFTEVISFLLKITWAFAEALADCRALLQGQKIPFVKTAADWHLEWNQLLRLDVSMLDGGGGDKGLDYGGYLNILLMLTNRDTRYRRMTHLMEKNIRLLPEYSNFSIKYCIYGVQAVFHCDMGMYGVYDVQTALSY